MTNVCTAGLLMLMPMPAGTVTGLPSRNTSRCACTWCSRVWNGFRGGDGTARCDRRGRTARGGGGGRVRRRRAGRRRDGDDDDNCGHSEPTPHVSLPTLSGVPRACHLVGGP